MSEDVIRAPYGQSLTVECIFEGGDWNKLAEMFPVVAYAHDQGKNRFYRTENILLLQPVWEEVAASEVPLNARRWPYWRPETRDTLPIET